MNKKQFVNAVAELEGIEQPVIDFYIVVCNGEIHSSFVSEDMAQGVVDRIDEENTKRWKYGVALKVTMHT